MNLILRTLIHIISLILRPFRRRWREGMPIRCLVAASSGLNDAGVEARVEVSIKQMLSADGRIEIVLTSFDRRQTLHHVSESCRVHIEELGRLKTAGAARLVLHCDALVVLEDGHLKSAVAFASSLKIPVVDFSLNAEPVFELVPEGKHWAETVLLGQGLDIMRPIIGIALKKTSKGALERVLADFADWVVKDYDAQIAVFAMSHDDVGQCRKFGMLMNSRHVIFDADHATAPRIAALLGQLNLFVASCYDDIALATVGNVPVICATKDKKAGLLMEELGLSEFIFHETDSSDAAQVLKMLAKRILENGKAVRKKLAAKLPVYSARSAENGRKFAEFMKKRWPL